MTLFERIHDIATGKITERPYTKEEIAENKANEERLIAEAAAYQKAIDDKAAIFQKLGLTAEEAQTLLS